ncbi:MAG: hypothetical protein EBX91_05730, partial [Actinobacteria bacterium]|nr:hypothetical protein [Actinomycetota bacterium]
MASLGIANLDKDLQRELIAGLDKVEALLSRHIQGDYPLLIETSRHLVEAGGKRFRPLITLLASHFGKGQSDEVIAAAVVCELTHVATLYHDDVMDEAKLRRGVTSANSRWSNTVAILTGDYLFSKASDLLADLGPEAVRLQAKTFERLVIGQIQETQGAKNGEDALKHYLQVVSEIAVALAAAGVVILTLGYGSLPWIALVLAISWGSYSLIKKSLNLGALETLSLETLFAFLPNLVFLLIIESNGSAEFGSTWSISILLFGAGAATVIPLLLFNGSTTRLPLSTVGLLQYITPTIMFFIGIYINNEDISTTKVIGFAFIWIALAVLSRDLYRSSRPLDDGIAK